MEEIITTFEKLDLSQILTITMSAFIALINLIILWLKTKKSALQKKLLSLNADTINSATDYVLSDYYLVTPDNVLYDTKDIKWISKDTITALEYQNYKKGGSLK